MELESADYLAEGWRLRLGTLNVRGALLAWRLGR